MPSALGITVQGRSIAQKTLSRAAHRLGLGEELLLWRCASGVPEILGFHGTDIGQAE